MLKPRIIKSAGCLICRAYIKKLKAQKYDFLIYDADLKEHTEQLDKWKIDKMPVVQIVDVKEDGTEEFVSQLAQGRWSARYIDGKIAEIKKRSNK